MIILLNILKSKYFYIALILLAIAGYIAYLNINIASKKNKIKDLNNKVTELEATNNYLYKGLTVRSNDIKIKDSFSNSSIVIDSITSNRFTDLEIFSISNVIADYYKS